MCFCGWYIHGPLNSQFPFSFETTAAAYVQSFAPFLGLNGTGDRGELQGTVYTALGAGVQFKINLSPSCLF